MTSAERQVHKGAQKPSQQAMHLVHRSPRMGMMQTPVCGLLYGTGVLGKSSHDADTCGRNREAS